MSRFPTVLAGLAVCAAALTASAAPSTGGPTTEVISVAMDGGPALRHAPSHSVTASADGRFVAFVSDALNFADGANGAQHVHVRDRSTGLTEIVSRSTGGTLGDGDGSYPALSADGRFVVFWSEASNLASGAPAGGLFIRDRIAGATDLLLNGDRGPGPTGEPRTHEPRGIAVSGDGRYVAVQLAQESAVPGGFGVWSIFVLDRQKGTLEPVSHPPGGGANGSAGQPAISADGRYIAFASSASNLVAGDTNNQTDVFLKDRLTGELRRISVSSAGAQADGSSGSPAISQDGRIVAFLSYAPNLRVGSSGNLYVRDLQAGATEQVDVNGSGGFCTALDLSADGSRISFESTATDLVPNDTNGLPDVFLRDRQSGTTTRVSVAAGGAQATGRAQDWPSPGGIALSGTGRYVFFESRATNLDALDQNYQADVFVHDHDAGSTMRLSEAPDGSDGVARAHTRGVAVSADGRYVTFASDAFNLVPDDTNGYADVFVRDRVSGATQLVSRAFGGYQGNHHSAWGTGAEFVRAYGPSISANGQYIAFASRATNLLGAVRPIAWDVYVRDRVANTLTLISGTPGKLGTGPSDFPALTPDGRYVGFTSMARDLASSGEKAPAPAAYLHDRLTRITELVSRAPGGQFLEVDPLTGPAVSSDGRYVAFSAYRGDVVPGVPLWHDVFLRDRVLQKTELVTVNSLEEPLDRGGGTIGGPVLSGDGRYVAFISNSTNVDGSALVGIFIRDRVEGTTTRASIGPGGLPLVADIQAPPSLSPNGHFLAFVARQPGTLRPFRAYLRDLLNGTTEEISESISGGSRASALSQIAEAGQGRFVGFRFSSAYSARMGSLNDYEGPADVLLRDRGGPPAAPLNVTAGAIAPSQVNLTWNDGSPDEGCFRIERRLFGRGEFTEIASVEANVTSFVDTTCVPDTRYEYRVRAGNGFGSSPYSNTAAAQTPPLPPPPPPVPTVTVVSVTERKVLLSCSVGSWMSVSYQIARVTVGGSDTPLVRGNEGSYFYDTQVQPGTTYEYRVRAGGAGGWSPFSSPVTVRTLPESGQLIVPRSVVFGTVFRGRGRDATLVVQNGSRTGNLRINSAIHEAGVPFTVAAGGGPQVLPPRGKHRITLRFAPTARGKASGHLRIESGDPKRPDVLVILNGKGL